MGDIMKVLNKPIDIIACHDAQGKITPIKFKIQEDGEVRTIKINRVIDIVPEKFLGKLVLRFICVSVIDNIEKRYELQFHPDTCNWILYKM